MINFSNNKPGFEITYYFKNGISLEIASRMINPLLRAGITTHFTRLSRSGIVYQIRIVVENKKLEDALDLTEVVDLIHELRNEEMSLKLKSGL